MNSEEIKKRVDDKILKCFDLEGFDRYFENFMFNGAKRLRALYVYKTAELLDYKPDDKILNLAAGIELIHGASLIHDDILDEGQIRRNTPCIHLTKGCKTAVLVGDYLLGTAMKLIFEIKNPKISEILSNAGLSMTISEVQALENRFKKPDLKLYLKRSKEKTAPLFLAGARGVYEIAQIKENEKFLKFTENFALCFQIKDDLNNFFNNEKNKFSSDKSSGIYTLADILAGENNCDKIDICENFLTRKIEETKDILKEFPPSKKSGFADLFNLFEGK
ncbi:MAG: polyprenyl synthetase family protein [Candidatus Gastranaerophilales bacterium]|nr:polyprenyl synthetase family protein [Candidatus Gastranaerophilales bacterium]